MFIAGLGLGFSIPSVAGNAADCVGGPSSHLSIQTEKGRKRTGLIPNMTSLDSLVAEAAH